MNNKASSLKRAIEEFARRQGIDAEMHQNLVKEAIHLLSGLSDAGILRHAVFQGGTALRLCYGGDRYSEDLDFVCGKAGSYFSNVEFKELIEAALETTKKTLNRDFGIDTDQISLKKPLHPDLVTQEPITVAAWQIIVPIEATPRAPKIAHQDRIRQCPRARNQTDAGTRNTRPRSGPGRDPHGRNAQ
jgi:predicted nucleotidyltransferase component of viral defense system